VSGAPLDGIRVLDLTWVLAGPYCTMALADLGAEVIKLEDPQGPDYTRTIPPHVGDVSHYFLSVNRGKKGVALDLKDPAARRAGFELARTCDVVVENFRPGVIERLGMGYEKLREARPGIVLCSLSGFGQSGPEVGRPAVDVVVQALSGAMSLNGEPDGEPLKLSVPLGDLAGSMWATIGVLAALRNRDRTGEGTHVDVSLLDSMTSLTSYLAQMFLVTGEEPERTGNRHSTVPAFGRYVASDGEMVLAAQMDPLWRRFCAAAGREDLLEEPRFASVPERRRNFDEVEKMVSATIAKRTVGEWEQAFGDAGVPAARVQSLGEALTSEHAVARGLLAEIDQPGAGTVKVLAPVLRFLDGIEEPPLRPAPGLGEHTRSALLEAGVSAADIEDLIAAGTAVAG
jgi:crotonobetainyl-CoA:carnitine CoA-transferase CaiB-like acyl-CoA transferase